MDSMFQPAGLHGYAPPYHLSPIPRFYADRQAASDRNQTASTAAEIDLRSRRTSSAMPPIT